MGHRTAAALIFIWIVVIAIHAIRNYKNQRVFYWGWIIALILVSLQVLTGMTVVLTRLNLFIAHATLAFDYVIIRVIDLYDFTRFKKSNSKIIKIDYP